MQGGYAIPSRLCRSSASAKDGRVPWRLGFRASTAEKALTGPLFCSLYFRVRTLRHLIRLYGGAAREPELGQLEALEGLVSMSRGSPRLGGLTLGGCKIEFIGESSERVRVCRRRSGEAISAMPIEPGQSVDWDRGRFSISAPAALQSRATVETLGMSRWAGVKRQIPELASLRCRRDGRYLARDRARRRDRRSPSAR